jgi:hypothetical protein
MEKRDLRVFMREDAKVEQIVTAPGPDTILGDDGKPAMLEIKVLSNATIRSINDKYTSRVMATDKKGNPYIQGGEVAFKVTTDTQKATGHILAEALVHPNLKDKELMEFFGCVDITEMAAKVFPRTDEYSHVNRVVMAALGLTREADDSDTDNTLEEAKN